MAGKRIQSESPFIQSNRDRKLKSLLQFASKQFDHISTSIHFNFQNSLHSFLNLYFVQIQLFSCLHVLFFFSAFFYFFKYQTNSGRRTYFDGKRCFSCMCSSNRERKKKIFFSNCCFVFIRIALHSRMKTHT